MVLHAMENVIKSDDRFNNVRSLVEHHALSPLTHCCISNFRARGLIFLSQGLEHLRRPDHRHMGGLADPKHLLLHFSHPPAQLVVLKTQSGTYLSLPWRPPAHNCASRFSAGPIDM